MEVPRSTISLLFLLLAAFMVADTLAASMENTKDGEGLMRTASKDPTTSLESQGSSLLRRLLHGSDGPRRGAMTCDRNPKVCRRKGSPGRHCCKRRCVNLGCDNLNCGECGKKCKYGELCCRSKCVNILNNKKNCGGCHQKCSKGSYCKYGMCSYA